MKGKFITFEGSEGCGKSTQSRLLFQYLKNKGYDAVYLREPGGVKVSEKIRKLLLDSNNEISPVCETLLYMAARAEVVDKVIRPALASGKTVICDRFMDSTVAYQGYGLGIDIRAITYIGGFATKGIKPDLTIFLDLPLRKGLKYRHQKEDRIEKRPLAYHRRVREGYLRMAGLEPARIKIIRVDAEKSVTQSKVREAVLREIKDKACHLKR